MKKLRELFRRKEDVVQFDSRKYGCCLNDRFSWFETKDEMMKFIDSYSKSNTIFSLSMFRTDVFNLIK